MGVFVSQDLTLNSGITIHSYYINIGNSTITVSKKEVEVVMSVWASQEAYAAGASPLTAMFVKADYDQGENIFSVLYTKLKEELTSFQDA